jgi:uncharacterized protein YukE
MQSSQVRIVLSYLEDLRHTIGQASVDLGARTSIPQVDLSASWHIPDAFRNLQNRWDEHRDQLTDNLDGIHDALTSIRDSFQELDRKLAEQVAAP